MAKWINDTLAKRQRSPSVFGESIRSYVEGRGVTDERTGVEHDLQQTLDGDIGRFLRASLAAASKPVGKERK